MLNEIWQIKDFEHLKIDGFEIANSFSREHGRGGGSIIFIKNSIKYEKINSPRVNGEIETCAIKFNNNVFMLLYRPPSGDKNRFVEQMIEWIEERSTDAVYIAGDFNINATNNEISYFDQIKNSTNLSPMINVPTRLASNTCIDNILTNINGEHKVSSICIADHQALTSKLNLVMKERRPVIKYKYREMSEANWLAFKNNVARIKIRGTEIDDMWSNLCDDIKLMVTESFPEKTAKQKYNFVMTQGLLKSKNRKNRLFRQYKRGIIDKKVYTDYNKIYRKLIVKEREKSFSDKMIQCGSNSKKKW